MKNIIFFSKNLSIGGMEVALLNLVNRLSDKYNVTLVLEEKKGELLKYINKNINIKEYKVSSNQNVIIRKSINLIRRILWILRYRNYYDFSCNYATYSIAGSKLALISSRNSLLYVHSDYCGLYNNSTFAIKSFFENINIKKFKKVAFVSKESMQNIKEIYKDISEKFVVINNYFDYKKYNKDKLKLKNNTFEKKFLFLGRLEEESKRIYRLIDAISICKKNKKRYSLWIVGDGKDKQAYKEYVNEKGLGDYITFYNSIPNPSKYLNSCDCLVLSSQYEGFPVVYLEALYFRKNILSTIKVSDDFINIEQYATIVNKSAESIAKGMEKINIKEQKQFNSFDEYNNKNIDKIINIIEVKK